MDYPRGSMFLGSSRMRGIDEKILIFPFLITLVIYFICGKREDRKIAKKDLLLDLMFILYSFILIAILYFPIEIYKERDFSGLVLTLVPFNHEAKLFSGGLTRVEIRYLIKNVVGNFLLFVPMAVYFFFRFPEKRKKCFFLLLTFSIGGEILQLLLVLLTGNVARIFDITDLILNCGGAMITWGLLTVIFRGKEERSDSHE